MVIRRASISFLLLMGIASAQSSLDPVSSATMTNSGKAVPTIPTLVIPAGTRVPLSLKQATLVHLGVLLLATICLPIAVAHGYDRPPDHGVALWVIGLIIHLATRPKGNLVPCPHCQKKRLEGLAVCPHCGQP